jgi:hypothetical protein
MILSIRIYKRGVALLAAVMLLAFLMLSPLAELYCEHDHSCCTKDCLICLVSNALAELRISLRAMLCTIAILLFIYVCEAMRSGGFYIAFSSPVALKTKITS